MRFGADLAVSTTASNWLELTWSAPGDDDYTGTASRYEMRYSIAPINAGNFESALLAPDPPDPSPVGTPESMTIAGLDFNRISSMVGVNRSNARHGRQCGHHTCPPK